MKVHMFFERRDIWVGVYGPTPYRAVKDGFEFRLYVCIIPTLPIVLTWTKR